MNVIHFLSIVKSNRFILQPFKMGKHRGLGFHLFHDVSLSSDVGLHGWVHPPVAKVHRSRAGCCMSSQLSVLRLRQWVSVGSYPGVLQCKDRIKSFSAVIAHQMVGRGGGVYFFFLRFATSCASSLLTFCSQSATKEQRGTERAWVYGKRFFRALWGSITRGEPPPASADER